MEKRKSKSILIIGIIVLLSLLLYKIKTVQFYDKEFERAVRETIGRSDVRTYIKREKPVRGFLLKEDIERVEEIFIDLNEYHIRDLRDLKNFKNLRSLDISYIPKGVQPEQTDMPQNIRGISSLTRLERLCLFRLQVDNSDFDLSLTGVKLLSVDNCISPDYNFIEKFPNVEILVLRSNPINSFEFIKKLDYLERLQFSDNQYIGSLEPLEGCPAQEITLSIFSDTPQIFKQLPSIPAVKELYLGGEAIPTREEAERYYRWANLESISLKGDTYHVKTQTWIENKE